MSDEQLRAHVAKVRKRFNATFVHTTEEVERSVVEGSELTGAVGQPVDTGNLRGSWIPEFVSDEEWKIETNASYAKAIEDNVRGVTFKNHGAHSVRDTIQGFDKIQTFAANKAKAEHD